MRLTYILNGFGQTEFQTVSAARINPAPAEPSLPSHQSTRAGSAMLHWERPRTSTPPRTPLMTPLRRGATCRRRNARPSSSGSPKRSRHVPRKSRSANAGIPGRPIASCRRPRSEAPKTSGTSPTRPSLHGTDTTSPRPDLLMSPPACQLARWASSRPGTRPSCSRPGRSRQPSPPAARWSTSRPNCRRSLQGCSSRLPRTLASRQAFSTPSTAMARKQARHSASTRY